MYPNPQDALPLPGRPNLEQYRKLAKDLVKASRVNDSAAIDRWAAQWVETLAPRVSDGGTDADPVRQRRDITARAQRVAGFAREKLSRTGAPAPTGLLADAQFVIARAHGFLSWPTFVEHLESLVRGNTSISTFETAADAIVAG